MNKLNKFSRALLVIVMMLIVALPTLAHDFEVDGIYYNITSETNKTVEVTFRGDFTADYTREYFGDIIIPDTVNFNNITYVVDGIGKSAFYDNKNHTDITSVTIGNNVTYIGEYAFNDCQGLSYIVISDNVITIGRNAFQACINLTSITFGKSVQFIGENALYSTKLSSVVWNAINCPNFNKTPFIATPSNITSFSFGNSVEHIPANLCNGLSGLTSITIPKSVKTIGDLAFNGCNFTKVYARPTLPPTITPLSFTSNIYENATLYVYENSSEFYTEDEYWQNFINVSTLSGGTKLEPINLTIKFPESGTIIHEETYNKNVNLSFKANEDWKINSVTFNEEDVTAELDEEGNYTTPVLTADAILVVVFEKIETGVESISEKNDIKVYANNGEVRIVGADAQSDVAIYNSIGALVYKGYDKTIALNGNGVYILTIEGRTFKFAM